MDLYMKNKKSLIYVNFAPYENAGKILDYILETFEIVAVFSFNFHKLGKGQKKGTLQIYKNGTIIGTYRLHQMSIPIPVSLLFLLLPLRSLLIFLQVFYYGYDLKRKYGTFNFYFSVNAFTAWVGNILKHYNIVNKTVFWVWDYYPPLHSNKIILIMRWLYWQFDKIATKSDRVSFLNKRLEDLRKDINIISLSINYPIVPIGTDPLPPHKIVPHAHKKIRIGFLGVLKKSQGIDLVFDMANALLKEFPSLTFEIIGSGPDEEYFKDRANKSSLPTKLYGFVPKDREVLKIISRWTIGVALYIPEESNVSYYTDNSKIKKYLEFGIPVIVTNIFFSKEVAKNRAGVVIDYFKPYQFIVALRTILLHYPQYQKSALQLASKYYYKKIYSELFFDKHQSKSK